MIDPDKVWSKCFSLPGTTSRPGLCWYHFSPTIPPKASLFLVLLLVTLIRAASNAEGDSYYTSNRATEAQVVELAISVLCQIPTINPNIGIILHLVKIFVHVCMMVDRQVLK